MPRKLVALIAFTLAACGGDDASVDTGAPVDSGATDTGSGDIGMPDTGPEDTGSADTIVMDTGVMDTAPATTMSMRVMLNVIRTGGTELTTYWDDVCAMGS